MGTCAKARAADAPWYAPWAGISDDWAWFWCMMTTRKTTAGAPLRDLLGPLPLPWAVSSNVSVSDDGKAQLGAGSSTGSADDNWLYMSAVCYLFGLNIHKARGYPVGLINSNW